MAVLMRSAEHLLLEKNLLLTVFLDYGIEMYFTGDPVKQKKVQNEFYFPLTPPLTQC